PAVRCTISARNACKRWRKDSSASRRWTVRTATPALRAAFSTVAPQAKAKSRASSACCRPRWAIVGSPLSSGFASPVPPGAAESQRALPLRLAPCQGLEALDDDIPIRWVKFHQDRLSPALLGRDERRATAAEEVEHVLAGTG